MNRAFILIAAMATAATLNAQSKPNIGALVKSALGESIVPYSAVRPILADFDGDGQTDLAVVVDFNKHLAAWLRRGMVIHNLDSPSLAPMHVDSEQHFCFGLLILRSKDPAQKTLFYGCFTGWHAISGAKAAIDLDMESGEKLRLFSDGTNFHTRVLRKP